MDKKNWLIIWSIFVAVLVVVSVISTIPKLQTDPNQIVSETPSQTNTYQETLSKAPLPSAFRQLVSPIPIQPTINKQKAKIGWLLFRDPNLSSNNNISCESCHSLTTNGAEQSSVSVGVGGHGSRNSLTVFNVAYNYRFFWDGRANSLSDQLDGPVHNVLEMDSN